MLLEVEDQTQVSGLRNDTSVNSTIDTLEDKYNKYLVNSLKNVFLILELMNST